MRFLKDLCQSLTHQFIIGFVDEWIRTARRERSEGRLVIPSDKITVGEHKIRPTFISAAMQLARSDRWHVDAWPIITEWCRDQVTPSMDYGRTLGWPGLSYARIWWVSRRSPQLRPGNARAQLNLRIGIRILDSNHRKRDIDAARSIQPEHIGAALELVCLGWQKLLLFISTSDSSLTLLPSLLPFDDD